MIPYLETIKELYDLQKFSIKMGLENIDRICKSLNNPQQSYPIIHIAGTNGKGSTSKIIQTIFSEHGLKVGLYTSPHLVDFRERITINGKLIEKDFIVQFWQTVSALIAELKATFFDTTTALAFDYFKHKNVDVAVIETGLGGRLDSTNIVNPVSVVITPIEIDHVKQLGRHLKSIAHEKSSIIKNDTTVFTANQKKPVMEVLEKASSRALALYKSSECVKIKSIQCGLENQIINLSDKSRKDKIEHLILNLVGKYQQSNLSLAYLCSRWYLETLGREFSVQKFRKSLLEVIWPGRLQLISKSPIIYFDVSHNYSGFKQTLDFADDNILKGEKYLLLGLLKDKAYQPIVRRIKKTFQNITLVEPRHEHALPISILQAEFGKHGLNVKISESIRDAYGIIASKLKPEDALFVMGSHYIIGDLLEISAKKT